ncbi:hypothetical protein RhiirA1_468235 [Rhizophagus irregularis]|uniref:Uncharacterized protein n=1 Tax=Rhizophagus irregularis TaxID=588596 RepID=A0A2N0RAJ1_9GLOM|nr:hypothetical protein RhiirA1_468235 [Rhizophagus irregularis]
MDIHECIIFTEFLWKTWRINGNIWIKIFYRLKNKQLKFREAKEEGFFFNQKKIISFEILEGKNNNIDYID